MRFSSANIEKLTGEPAVPSPNQMYLVETPEGVTKFYLSNTNSELILLNEYSFNVSVGEGEVPFGGPDDTLISSSDFTFDGSLLSVPSLTLTDLTAGSVLFLNSSLVVSEDNTSLYYDDLNNTLRLRDKNYTNATTGWSPSTQISSIQIGDNSIIVNDAVSSVYGILIDINRGRTSSGGTQSSALRCRVNDGKAAGTGATTGVESFVTNIGNTSGNSYLQGVEGVAQIIETGGTAVGMEAFASTSGVAAHTITNLYAFKGSSGSAASWSVTNAYGLQYTGSFGGAAVTNLYGLRFNNWGGSNVTNSYGIFLGSSIDVGTVLRYAIFSQSTSPSLFTGTVAVPDDAYNATTWDGNFTVPTKNAIRDKIEALGIGYTDEQAQDAIGTILVDSATIDFTYTDATPSITAIVVDDSITFSKLQNITTNKLLGRSTASSGDIEELSIGTGLSLSTGTLSNTITQYTDEMAQDAVGNILFDGTTIDLEYDDFDNIITAEIITDSVTFGYLQNIATNKLLGRSTAGTGDIEVLSIGSGLALSAGTLSNTVSAYTDEQAQDAIGTILVDSTTIHFTYSDSTPSITATFSGTTDDVPEGSTNLYCTVDAVANDILSLIDNASSSTIDLDVGIGLGYHFFAEVRDSSLGFRKLQTISTNKLLGRSTAGTGDIEQISIGTGLSLSTGTLSNTVSSYTDEQAQDAIGAMVDSSLTYVDATPLLQRAALTGDVTASAGSNTLTIANDVVTYAKIQNISATDKVLGRATVGAGDTEEITFTTFARQLADDTSFSAMRTTLGLGSMAVQNSNNVSISGGSATFDNDNLAMWNTAKTFQLVLHNTAVLTSDRDLSVNVNDASRTISLNGNLTVSSVATLSGTNTGDQTLNGLLPSQTSNSGKYLTTDGTNSSWGTVASSVAIGSSITSATAGSVLFAGTAGILQQDNANFFWDDTNNRLGIGTATPGSGLDVQVTANTIGLRVQGTAASTATSGNGANALDLLNISTVAGQAASESASNRRGGNGSNIFFSGGNGGTYSGVGSGPNSRGGLGGSYAFTSGNGGASTSATGTGKGGASGSMTFQCGIGGESSASTSSGSGGTITFFAGSGGNNSVSAGTAGSGGNVAFDAGFPGTASGGATAGIYGSLTFGTAASLSIEFGNNTTTTNGILFNVPIKRYNNITTAGWGTPAVYGSGRLTAQTAAISTVATYTVGASDGSFLVSANVLVTSSTVHSFTVTCAYTDESNTARTATLSFNNLAGTMLTTLVNAAGAVPYAGIPIQIRAKSGTPITVATVGTFTTVTYNCEAVITQIT